MTYSGQVSGPQKMVSGGAALAAMFAVGFGLASGLDLNVVRRASEAITAIALPAPSPPREEAVPAPAPTERAAGKASAANRRAVAAEVAAPPPKLPPPPLSIAAAPKPGAGNDPSAGATPDPGPGSGAGGHGDGFGAGGSGSGSGTGGGTKAVWQSGTIRDRDYPRAASREKAGGEVEVRFTIEASGHVTGCRVTRSSGNAALDRTTCDLIEARFRFRPATNAAGEPIASSYGWRQSWWLEPRG